MSDLLEVSDLHVWFDLPSAGRQREGRQVHAVQGVSFRLQPGERFGLVGESGCGKTTTILALMGLLPPNASLAGEVRLDGRNIVAGGEDSVRPYRWKDIAMVFQGAMNALNPVQKVGSQIAEPMAIHGVAEGAAARTRARELLELVGIPAAGAERYPHEFSGGMRQRASIAMALACQPKILLADEPTTALDVMVQAQILELLARLTEELDLALILVTHDLPVVAQMCDRAAVMYAGEIVETGAMDTLFHEPAHPYTRLLFAATPDLYGEEDVASIPGAPPRLDAEIIGCPFRPRCDVVLERCATDRPALRPAGLAHYAACHRVGASRRDLAGAI
jgi:oligopeptide/dipeptide ABC transporter ATP-binding protein